MDCQHAQIAGFYDIANPWAADAEFYLSLAGLHPCSVLDLGGGTGTLCCALAERGHRVTGVDPAAAMLAVARSKPRSAYSLQPFADDLTAFFGTAFVSTRRST
jgi:ubiquinone/menaquinone biosynthesis C-methylase UbiE